MQRKTVHLLLLLLLFFCFGQVSTFAQLSPIPLAERVESSNAVVVAKVSGQNTYWGPNGFIYTAHELVVTSELKSEGLPKRLIVLTEGGRKGDTILEVTHELQLAKGDSGLFMLEPAHGSILLRGYDRPMPLFRPYAGPQGFVNARPNTRGYLETEIDQYKMVDSEARPRYRSLAVLEKDLRKNMGH